MKPEELTGADAVQYKAFKRFLRAVADAPKAGKHPVLPHWWVTYANGGPEPPLLWEGDYV